MDAGYDSGCDGLSDTEVEEMLPAPPQLSSGTSSNAVPRQYSFLAPNLHLPDKIWSEPWIPLEQSTGIYIGGGLSHDVFDKASPDDPPVLHIEGANTAELALQFREVLVSCITKGDFTQVLLKDRTFHVFDPLTGQGASGCGIEMETIHRAFSGFLDNSSQWFLNLLDDRMSLRMMHSAATSRHVPQDRILSFKLLGALCALTMILERAPEPLDPGVFQFLFNDKNLNLLHRGFVSKWHPGLRELLDRWQALGHLDDIDDFCHYFASYMDQDIASVRARDEESHNALAADMLHSGIIGPQSSGHPEWKAFEWGLSLPCRNGFNFFQVARNFTGGTEGFLSHVYSSTITSPEMLIPYITFIAPPPSFTAELRVLLNNDAASFDDIIISFLQRSGIPCQESMSYKKQFIDPIIDFDQASHPSFRSQLFAWAASGSPSVDPSGFQFWVKWVHGYDSSYEENREACKSFMGEGKLSFKTCFHDIFIPTPHVIKLARKHSTMADGLALFPKAVDDWLLGEFAAAVGKHSRG